ELSPRGEQLQEPLRLPSDSELPAALDLSPGGRWVALRANHAAEVWLGDLKDRRWVKLETRHVNAAVFSPSAPHQVLLLVGTSSLNFKNDDVVKSACELWDLDQVSAGCAARLLLPGRPNVAEPVEGGGWLIGLRTGEILQVDRDLVRVGPAWWPLERQAVGGGLGFEEGIPVSGLATPERNHLIVTSGHDDRPQACFSWHTRSARGWARSERFELPGRTLSIFSCQLSPDRSTLALVIRDGSESRCELWRLRRPR
ncbi:MAG TPA: hypothetical protein DEA08_23210, partial [Planctomycetes bacterium]|nr:hypothetical protein [Planctomycetota bacterium]